MVILQCADASAERQRISGLGLRPVWSCDRLAYTATHFHPADCGGILLSVDSVEPGADLHAPFCSWEPAGPDWRRAIRQHVVRDLVGAELQSDDPAGLVQLWSRILDRPAIDEGAAGYTIGLDDARLAFRPSLDGRGVGVGAVELTAVDAGRAKASAGARGLISETGGIEICGVRINLV